jgi:SAM-dependent methyltransferase
VTFRVAPAERLGVPDGSLDVVCAVAVLHHLDWPAALREARRALRPGGLLWLSEPNMLNPQVALQCHIPALMRYIEGTPDETAFVRWSLARDLRDAGFRDVEVRPFDWLHPSVPGPLIGLGRATSALLERLPLVREAAGSLEVVARA